MKKLCCELCGGNELIKHDGYFTCVSCGTKYTLEEARKLKIDGVIKVDKSEDKLNLLKLLNIEFGLLRDDDCIIFERKIENIVKLANKILEIDSSDQLAMFIKRIPKSIETYTFSISFSNINLEDLKFLVNYNELNIDHIKRTILMGRLPYIFCDLTTFISDEEIDLLYKLSPITFRDDFLEMLNEVVSKLIVYKKIEINGRVVNEMFICKNINNFIKRCDIYDIDFKVFNGFLGLIRVVAK